MGYRIQYGQTMTKTPIADEKVLHKLKKLRLLIPVCVFFLISLLWSKRDAVHDFLIPGNAAVTEAAVAEFVNDLRAGENFGDAITAFCQEIIENADIPG